MSTTCPCAELECLVRVRRFLESVRAVLAMPERLSKELHRLARVVGAVEKAAQQTSKHHDHRIEKLSTELSLLRQELHERLLQYHLQLGRLSEAINIRPQGQLGSRVPATLGAADVASVGRGGLNPSCDPKPIVFHPHEWLELSACPACRTVERTIVCEWNKLVLLDTAPDEQAACYDYAVCHGCGILYATRRPVGARYRYLVDNFEDVIDKDARNPLLNPYPLTDEDRERYRRLIARGVFVSDHEPGGSLPSVWRDRMENAGHVDLLGSLLNLRRARVP